MRIIRPRPKTAKWVAWRLKAELGHGARYECGAKKRGFSMHTCIETTNVQNLCITQSSMHSGRLMSELHTGCARQAFNTTEFLELLTIILRSDGTV